MNVEINVVNVRDGDAIIIMLRDKSRKALILIDGGYGKYFQRVQKRLNQLLPEFNNKIALLILTHYDNDHLSGCSKIFDNYSGHIDKIWMHKLRTPIGDSIDRITREISGFNRSILLRRGRHIRRFGGTSLTPLLEGLSDLRTFLLSIKRHNLEDKIEEVVAGDSLNNFPEIQVISPTPKYYNDNLSILTEQLFQEIVLENVRNRSMRLLEYNEFQDQLSGFEPCSLLETTSRGKVSIVNMMSIVTTINVGDDKYLFPADAGIETFTAHIPNWKDLLTNLSFMVLPHHGSKYNTSLEMINTFDPSTVFVSATGGVNRPSKFLESCLRSRGATIKVTNRPPETWYLKFKDGKFSRIMDA